MLKKIAIFLLVLILSTSAAYLFRAPILRSFATFLIKEDSLQKADAMFVLSGAGYVRGNEAARIYLMGFAKMVVCTGGNPQPGLMAFGIDTLESDVTVAALKSQGIADSVIVIIREGTSTKEEAVIILNYCRQNNLKKIIVVSSHFHTRRVNEVFREKFKNAGIELLVRGAPSLSFDEMLWWQSEDGLISVNNEWMKTFYYWWKY